MTSTKVFNLGSDYRLAWLVPKAPVSSRFKVAQKGTSHGKPQARNLSFPLSRLFGTQLAMLRTVYRTGCLTAARGTPLCTVAVAMSPR